MTRQYHLNQAARLVGVRAWRISYAISQGYLREVSRLSNQRIFTPADIIRIGEYFKQKTNKGRPAKEEHE
jgi:hypothetical protein